MGQFLYLGSFLSGRGSKMPVHTYTNWNTRPSDQEEQIEPFRKYFFICEGANTETFYFRRLIDLHQLKGNVSSNVGKIIEEIINEKPDI